MEAQDTTPNRAHAVHAALPDLQTVRLKGALRRMLRLKDRSYQELAEHLDCSLATVKRILNHEELSLSRLLTICEWLGLTLADLETAASQANAGETEYTEEQELFLAADPRYLVYLNHLWDGWSPERIATHFKLKAASADRYLRRLEQLGLVRVTAKGRAVPVHDRQPGWRKFGPLARGHFDRLTTSFMSFFTSRVKAAFAAPERFTASPVRSSMNTGDMSRATFDAMAAELRAVVKKFEDVAQVEGKIRPRSELGTYALLNCLTWLPPGETPGELESVFGTLTDL